MIKVTELSEIISKLPLPTKSSPTYCEFPYMRLDRSDGAIRFKLKLEVWSGEYRWYFNSIK